MISQNYSHDSKVWSKEYNLKGDLIKITGERDKDGNFIGKISDPIPLSFNSDGIMSLNI